MPTRPYATTTRLSSRPALAGAGLLRAGIGAALMARPAALPKAMGVDAVTARQVGWVTAMVGARDLALGVGLVAAVRRRSDPRPWLAAAAFSDAVDAVAFSAALARGRANPVVGAGSAGIALLGAVSGVRALRALA